MGLELNGNNLQNVRESNLAVIIKLLLENENCSRVTLSKQTGLKQATITNIINQLLEWQVVEESGVINGKVGRHSIGICINQKKYRTIGIRIGRRNIHIGVFTLNGKLLDYSVYPTDGVKGEDDTYNLLEKGIDEYYSKYYDDIILGVGFALPGVYVSDKKIINMFGSHQLISENIIKRISQRFNTQILIENDANCGALAQYWYKKGPGFSNIVYVSTDAGIGAGIIVNGSLYKGANGNAGEIGHTSINFTGPVCQCGNRGCLELYCSTTAFTQRYRDEAFRNPLYRDCVDLSTDRILEEVNNGDPLANEVLDKTAFYLSLGIVNIINTIDPELIIISGKLSVTKNRLLDCINKSICQFIGQDRLKNITISLSEFEDKSIITGATALVIDSVLKNPTAVFRKQNPVLLYKQHLSNG